MIISDFHTHSSNSGDCDAKMSNQIEAALKKGLVHLCITEHMDIDYPQVPEGHEDEECSFLLDAEKYYAEYIEMKEKYASCSSSNTPFNLFFGVELGLQSQIADDNLAFSRSYPFDFIIASSHTLYKLDPYYKEFWDDRDEANVTKDYFESIYENIGLFNNFDVYGHLDYIVRYGKNKDYIFADYSDIIEAILKKLIDMGKGIEINTCGLRNGLKYPNPRPEILKLYRSLGGEIITVGSDAHRSEHVAWEFDIAEKLLIDCGFKYYTIFSERKPEFIKL